MKKTIEGYLTKKGNTVEHAHKGRWIVRCFEQYHKYWLFRTLKDVRQWEKDGEPDVHPLAYW
jgi:hypothetical protein